MADLAVERLRLRFGGLTVLDDVSMAVAAGELFALIGPNPPHDYCWLQVEKGG